MSTVQEQATRVAKVTRPGRLFVLVDEKDGSVVNDRIMSEVKKQAVNEDNKLYLVNGEWVTASGWTLPYSGSAGPASGSPRPPKSPSVQSNVSYKAKPTQSMAPEIEIDFAIVRNLNEDFSDEVILDAALAAMDVTHEELIKFLGESHVTKPRDLILDDLRWRFLVRNVLRGKNLLMTGPTGAGKTKAALSAAKALGRNIYIIHMGASQDPRSTLIGTTKFDPERGTYFSGSRFVKAIQEPGAIVVLEELSRAHPEAGNILMSVLDDTQRTLHIDEEDDDKVIEVAEGVSFIATANIGVEFTATRTLDRALMDRLIVLEMDYLTKSEEATLIKYRYPTVPDLAIQAIVELTAATRENVKSESPNISTALSTRAALEVAGLVYDGFDLLGAFEVGFYPEYSTDGGANSERTFVKQLAQKFLVDSNAISTPPPPFSVDPT